jgi:hypothetical protein
VGAAAETSEPTVKAPTAELGEGEFVAASIRTEHPDHPQWREPTQVYFRRTPGGWKTVGLFR